GMAAADCKGDDGCRPKLECRCHAGASQRADTAELITRLGNGLIRLPVNADVERWIDLAPDLDEDVHATGLSTRFSTTSSARSLTRQLPLPASRLPRPASSITRQKGQPVATVRAPLSST